MHRRANGRGNGKQRSLTRLLRAVRTLGVDGLDDEGLDLGHVEKGGRLVFEHRRPLVQALAKRLLFHQRLAEAHVDAPFDLPFDQERVDGAAHVMGDPDPIHRDQSGARVRVEVAHAGRVAVSGARPDTRSFVRPGDPRRRVAAGAGQRPEARLGKHGGLLEGDVLVLATVCFHRFRQQSAHLPCRLERGIARHESDAR